MADVATASAVGETPAGSTVAILVSPPRQYNAQGIPSNSTATIWVGSIDVSGFVPVGVDSEPLDITVTHPDGVTTDTFSVTTGSNGTATQSYDLSTTGSGDGNYEFAVEDPDASEEVIASVTVPVGPVVEATNVSTESIFTGQQATYPFLVHDGESGVQGIDVAIQVTRIDDGSTVASTTATSDSDGFAEISFTPSSPGQLVIEASLDGGSSGTVTPTAVDRLFRTGFEFSQARPGATCAFGGYIDTGSGFLANTDVVVRILDGTSVVTEQTVTTDASGFVVIQYDVPSDPQASVLTPEVELTDGTSIPLSSRYIGVNDPDSGSEPAVQLAASLRDDPVAPGDSVTVDIEATDGGSGISNQDVEIFLRYGNSGPPLYKTTVTTGSDGTASASTTLPSGAPDTHSLSGTAAMQYDSSTYDDTIGGAIRTYAFDVTRPQLSPGAQETYDMTVTELGTSTGVSGLPLQLDAGHGMGRGGTFATTSMESTSDGTDSTTIQVPSDIGFKSLTNRITRYRPAFGFTQRYVDHPGSVSTSETIDAGESTQFSFSIPDSTTTCGLAVGTTFDAAGHSFATQFEGPGTFSLDIPSSLSSGDTITVFVWSIDGGGTLYSAIGGFTVDSGAGDISLSASGQSNVSVGGKATISISADNVDQLTIGKLWTDWTLSSSPVGGSVTDKIAGAGEVVIDYGSDQSSVSPSITVSLPDDYIGGTYVIEISASNSSGETATATAQISIG